jgi:hypothetical protein
MGRGFQAQKNASFAKLPDGVDILARQWRRLYNVGLKESVFVVSSWHALDCVLVQISTRTFDHEVVVLILHLLQELIGS